MYRVLKIVVQICATLLECHIKQWNGDCNCSYGKCTFGDSLWRPNILTSCGPRCCYTMLLHLVQCFLTFRPFIQDASSKATDNSSYTHSHTNRHGQAIGPTGKCPADTQFLGRGCHNLIKEKSCSVSLCLSVSLSLSLSLSIYIYIYIYIYK